MDDNSYKWDNYKKENVIGEWEKIQVEDALSVLTKREKEIYLMAKGHCIYYSIIANYLLVEVVYRK